MDARDDFERQLVDALEHLYDPAHLLAHPLAGLVAPRGNAESPGQGLHRTLRAAIAQVKPSADAPLHSPAWRAYRYLSLRYVEVLTIDQVARELGISARQCRRDHHEALAALGTILKNMLMDQPGLDPAPDRSAATVESSDGDLLAAELGKIGATTSVAPTDLGRVIESVASTLAVLAERKGVALQLDLPSALPPVAVDRTVLRQLLVQLLLYAIDLAADGRVALAAASSAEAARVVISAWSGQKHGGSQTFAGAPEVTRLTICRRLADLQGFGLQIEPGPDGLVASLAVPSGRAPLVLVVDDNADVLHLYRHYLDGIYDVVEATSGAQAVALARQLRPRVITLDVMMPSQDGWEVLQTLKHDPITRDIPVIVCSVLREGELALSLGATDYLTKPVTAPQLVSALHRCRLAS